MTNDKYHQDFLTMQPSGTHFLIYTDTGVGKLPFQLVRTKEQTQGVLKL